MWDILCLASLHHASTNNSPRLPLLPQQQLTRRRPNVYLATRIAWEQEQPYTDTATSWRLQSEQLALDHLIFPVVEDTARASRIYKESQQPAGVHSPTSDFRKMRNPMVASRAKILLAASFLRLGAHADWPIKTVDLTDGGDECEQTPSFGSRLYLRSYIDGLTRALPCRPDFI